MSLLEAVQSCWLHRQSCIPRAPGICFPAGGFGAGGSTERSAGRATCQWERSERRKLLRLSLSCLISVSRSRFFWKHAVSGKMLTKERRQGG